MEVSEHNRESGNKKEKLVDWKPHPPGVETPELHSNYLQFLFLLLLFSYFFRVKTLFSKSKQFIPLYEIHFFQPWHYKFGG